MQGGAKSAVLTQDPWGCPTDSKQNFFGAKPKQQQQAMNAASKSSWPNGMTSSSGKAQAGSDPWGTTFKSREHFVEMHLF